MSEYRIGGWKRKIRVETWNSDLKDVEKIISKSTLFTSRQETYKKKLKMKCIFLFLSYIHHMPHVLLLICSSHPSISNPVALSPSLFSPMLHHSGCHHCLPIFVSFIWWPCPSPWPHLWSRSIEAERGQASTFWWFPLSLGLTSDVSEWVIRMPSTTWSHYLSYIYKVNISN